MKYVVCDIDGTLANDEHRAPLVQCPQPLWNSYFALCHRDKPILPTIRLLDYLFESHRVVLLTGRPIQVWKPTVRWLKDQGILYHDLLMRRDHHPPDSTTFKTAALLEEFPDATPHNTFTVLEDRTPVVHHWRSHGYTVWQVAGNDY